jgi:adenosylmethionine-8-amino-7-oxononanoate aminotransferase
MATIDTAYDTSTTPAGLDLDHFWMPFTNNRYFKENPRLLVSAKDMHYQAADGRKLLDGTAGLWCVNAGHGRAAIGAAVAEAVATLDFAPPSAWPPLPSASPANWRRSCRKGWTASLPTLARKALIPR